MADSDSNDSRWDSRQVVDMVFGAVVMGTVGTLIGLLVGGQAFSFGAGIGVAMGTVIGMFGGRRFLFSILIGTLFGGGLAWAVAGWEKISVGAGAGAAMGGFLGVQVSLLQDLWAERKRRAVSQDQQH